MSDSISTLTLELKRWNHEVYRHIIKRKCLLACRIERVKAALDRKCELSFGFGARFVY